MEKTQIIRQNNYKNTNKSPYSLCLENFKHNELIQELDLDNQAKKHICILNLSSLNDQSEADKLISNLTGQDGKIREVVALKISEFLENDKTSIFFQNGQTIDKIVAAICDINPNVARAITQSLLKIENKKELTEKIIKKTYLLINEIEEFDGDKKYVLNRKLFNLYWLLKSLNKLLDFTKKKDIGNILTKTYAIKDYPIREETAKILIKSGLQTKALKKIKEILKNDDNFYVKNVFIV